MVTNYLCRFHSACLTDTYGEPTVSVRYVTLSTRSSPLALCSAKNPSLAFPSRQRRAAALLPPIARMPYYRATFLPPTEDEAADILTHTATFVYRLRRRATLISRPKAERIDRRRPMSRAMLSTPPGMWRLPSIRTLPPSVLCVPSHRRPRASLFTATFLSAVNKDRFGLRVDRLRPPPPFRFFPDTSTPLRLPLHKFRDTSALLWLVELHCIYGYKLSLTATLSLYPAPPAAPTVSARYRSAVNPKPPLAFPARRCRAAALPPTVGARRQSPRSSHP